MRAYKRAYLPCPKLLKPRAMRGGNYTQTRCACKIALLDSNIDLITRSVAELPFVEDHFKASDVKKPAIFNCVFHKGCRFTT